MNENAPIIDVVPIKQSSTRLRPQDVHASSSQSASFGQSRTTGGSERVAASPAGALGGFMRMAAGAGLIAIGIPMLVLPGPGLLSITAGALLIASGMSRTRR